MAALLGAELPEDPGATIPWSVAARALEHAIETSPDPCVALRSGAAMSSRALNIVGLLMMSAPTVRRVVEASVRFSSLLATGVELELVEQGQLPEHAEVRFKLPPCSPRLARAMTEFIVAFTVHFANELHQQHGHIRHVSVQHSPPPHASEYPRYIGCRVAFDSPYNSVSIYARELELSLPGGDAATFELLCQRAEQAIRYKEQTVPLAERVKELLRAGDLERVDVAQLASQLKLSPSVLQRRLRDEGTTVSDLVDETRRVLALEAVLRDDLPIKALSERLGFSEPSAFHRAFRRWTGQTTRAYRQGKR